MEIRIRAAGESHVGRKRANNQDAFGFDLDLGLFVVCDGVGGNRAGEVASRLALDTMLDHFYPDGRGDNGGSALHYTMQKANHVLRYAAAREKVYAGMSTTMVSAHLGHSRMWVAHVGDSRAYLLRDGSLHRLTEDHSLFAERLREGIHSTNSSEAKKLGGVLTQALGAGDFVIPEVTAVPVKVGDCFLLTTDGLTNMLSSAEILSIMMAAPTPERACRRLVECANFAGGCDNITCLVVVVD
jgi:PPM family protein phosphatase